MKKSLFLLTLVISCPAVAQENLPPECRIFQERVPVDGATYQPGIDIHGKPVVPADVNAAPPVGLDGQTIVIPLSIDMASRMQGLNIPGVDMTSTVGFIEVGPGGRVRYNGQDLTGQMQVLCEEPAEPSSPDRQTPADAVEYAPVKEKPKNAAVPKPVTPPNPAVETPALQAPAAPTQVPTPAPTPVTEPEQGEMIEGGEYR